MRICLEAVLGSRWAIPFATIQKPVCRIKFHEWHDVFANEFFNRQIAPLCTNLDACL